MRNSGGKITMGIVDDMKIIITIIITTIIVISIIIVIIIIITIIIIIIMIQIFGANYLDTPLALLNTVLDVFLDIDFRLIF